jgi:hypothetical protein
MDQLELQPLYADTYIFHAQFQVKGQGHWDLLKFHILYADAPLHAQF